MSQSDVKKEERRERDSPEDLVPDVYSQEEEEVDTSSEGRQHLVENWEDLIWEDVVRVVVDLSVILTVPNIRSLKEHL